MRHNPCWYLVIIVVIGGIVLWLDNPLSHNAGDRLNTPLFDDVSVSDVSRVEIEALLDGVLIEKKEGKWLAWRMPTAVQKELVKEGGDQPAQVAIEADSNKIVKAIERMLMLKGESLVSRSPDQHATFEVAASTGTQVRLYDDTGEKIASLIIGKMGADYTSTYIRINEAPEVYQINSYIAGDFIPKVETWKAPTVWEKMKNR